MSTASAAAGVANLDAVTAEGAAFEQGLYVVVVVDHRLGTVESYGPLDPDAAATALLDLRALLAEEGLADEVSVTSARLHPPAQPEHPLGGWGLVGLFPQATNPPDRSAHGELQILLRLADCAP